MLFDSQVAAFAAVALVLTITPGNDTILVLRNAIRGGRRDGMIHGVGHLYRIVCACPAFRTGAVTGPDAFRGPVFMP